MYAITVFSSTAPTVAQKYPPAHRCWPPVPLAQVRQALEAKGGKWTLGREGHTSAFVDMKEQLGFSLQLQDPVEIR